MYPQGGLGIQQSKVFPPGGVNSYVLNSFVNDPNFNPANWTQVPTDAIEGLSVM